MCFAVIREYAFFSRLSLLFADKQSPLTFDNFRERDKNSRMSPNEYRLTPDGVPEHVTVGPVPLTISI